METFGELVAVSSGTETQELSEAQKVVSLARCGTHMIDQPPCAASVIQLRTPARHRRKY